MSCKLCLNTTVEKEKEGKEERREEEKIRKEKKYCSVFFMPKKLSHIEGQRCTKEQRARRINLNEYFLYNTLIIMSCEVLIIKIIKIHDNRLCVQRKIEKNVPSSRSVLEREKNYQLT